MLELDGARVTQTAAIARFVARRHVACCHAAARRRYAALTARCICIAAARLVMHCLSARRFVACRCIAVRLRHAALTARRHADRQARRCRP